MAVESDVMKLKKHLSNGDASGVYLFFGEELYLRDIYIEKLSKEVGVGKEAIQAEVERFLFKDSKPVSKFVVPIVEENKKKTVEEKSDLEEMILYLLTSKDMNIYNKVKAVVSPNEFKIPTNQKILSLLYGKYEIGDINNVDLMSVCETDEDFNTMTRIMMRTNVEDNFAKIAEDVLKNFEMNQLQERKKELIELIQKTTLTEERRKYEMELNEIIIKSVRR